MNQQIELHASSSNSSIALRNEEFNRQRLKNVAPGTVRITDPAKFAELQAQMKARQEEQAKIAAKREEERKLREGADYKTPEERARLAREAREQERAADDEARVIEGDDGKFDPKADYYAILEVSNAASAKEIVAAYRKAALSMHPDKYKNESVEQQEAIAKKFVSVSKAFKVLNNEEMRAAYDKCRDYMEANPNKGLPTLTKEEQALVMRGAGELSRLKRMGPKLKKHDDLEKRVELTLEELHFGCTKEVIVARRRVDYSGTSFVSEKAFHLVVKRGSREGDVLRFEDEGEETVDTHAGDLVFTVVVKAHPVWRRVGERGLELFVRLEDAASSRTDVFHVIELETIGGKQCMLVLRSMYEALVKGGCGGTWSKVITGQGLFDGHGKPSGDLTVSARFFPFFLEDERVKGNGRIKSCCGNVGEVLVLGSASDVVSASIVGGHVLKRVRHRIEASEMIDESAGRTPRVLLIDIGNDEVDLSLSSLSSSSSLSALRQIFAAVRASVTTVSVSPHRGLLDDAIWSTSAPYDVVVLNHAILSASTSSADREAIMATTRVHLTDVMSLIGLHHMRGADIVAIEGAVALLGLPSHKTKLDELDEEHDANFSEYDYTPILPYYRLRAGGGTNNAGFDDVLTSLDAAVPTTCVGVLDGSAYLVDPTTGEAEMIIAPHRDALITKATWDDRDAGEADDDFGFIVAYSCTT